MPRFGGIPNTRQFRELIREEALPLPTKRKTAPTLPVAPTLPMNMTKFPTSPVAPIAPNAVAQSAMANLPVEMQTILMPDSVSPIAESGISDMDTDIDKEIEKILAAAMAPPSQETVNADIAKFMGMEPEVSVDTVDPVTAAVEAAVGNGQPTTDKNPFGTYSGEGFIPPPKGSMNTQAFVNYYNPSTGETYMTPTGGYTAPEGWISGTKEDYERNKDYYDNILAGGEPDLSLLPGAGTETGTGTETQQPDFMTQLNDLIAQMQLEQTAAAEQQQQQQQQRQEQTAEMAQNYMIGQPAVGYNPYQSGQYQNNPYGAAGVPNMGGITSIPVPAPYQAPRTMT